MALVCEGGGQRGVSYRRRAGVSLCVRSLILSISTGTSAGGKISRRISATSPATGVKSLCAIPPKATFDPLRFVRGGNLIDLDCRWNLTAARMPLQMDTAARLFDSGKSFICVLPGGMPITRRAISRRQTKLASISPRLPAPYRVSYRARRYVRGHQPSGRWHYDAIPVQEAAKRGAVKTIVRSAPYPRKCITRRSGLSVWSAGWGAVYSRWSTRAAS